MKLATVQGGSHVIHLLMADIRHELDESELLHACELLGMLKPICLQRGSCVRFVRPGFNASLYVLRGAATRLAMDEKTRRQSLA